MSKKLNMVHVVIGYCGEYADATRWLVAAYKNKADAQEHSTKAEARAAELYEACISPDVGRPGRSARPSYLTLLDRLRDDKDRNEFDPSMRVDYTGTEYQVDSVLMLGSFSSTVLSQFQEHRSETL